MYRHILHIHDRSMFLGDPVPPNGRAPSRNLIFCVQIQQLAFGTRPISAAKIHSQDEILKPHSVIVICNNEASRGLWPELKTSEQSGAALLVADSIVLAGCSVVMLACGHMCLRVAHVPCCDGMTHWKGSHWQIYNTRW